MCGKAGTGFPINVECYVNSAFAKFFHLVVKKSDCGDDALVALLLEHPGHIEHGFETGDGHYHLPPEGRTKLNPYQTRN